MSGERRPFRRADIEIEHGDVDPTVVLDTLQRMQILRHVPPDRYEICHQVLAPAVLEWRRKFEASEAVQREGAERFVYVEEQGKLTRRAVTIGSREGGVTEIRRGLSGSERVLVGALEPAEQQ